MQEAPNLKKKDEQQERGNYDSAVYMKRVSDILGGHYPKLWFVAISLHHPLWFVRHCLKVRETARTLAESKSMF